MRESRDRALGKVGTSWALCAQHSHCLRLGRAGYLGIAGQRVQGEEKQPLDMKQMISGLCYSEACAVQLTGGLREVAWAGS